MPTYTINGKRVTTATPLSDAQIEEIAGSMSVDSRPSGAIAEAMTHRVASAPSDKNGTPTAMYYDPEKGMRPLTGMERFRYGFGAGGRNIAANLAEMLGQIPPERVKEMQVEQAAITKDSIPGKIGSFAGETAALYPIGGAIAAPFKRGGGILMGMAEGAGQGAVAAGPDDREMGAMLGGVTGGVLPSAQRMAKILSQGREMTPAARRLSRRGVDLTPGQMNPESAWGQVEEAMMALPVIGPRIKQARGRGWTQTQNLIAQEAAPPNVKMQPRQDPQAMFRDLIDAYDVAYNVGRGFPVRPVIVRTQGVDIPLSQALQITSKTVGDDASRKYANSFLQNELSGIRGRQLNSEDLFALRSRIRAEVRDLRKNTNAPFKAADMLENAEGRITDALESQLPPDVMKQIRAIDAKYGNFKTIEGALYRAGDKEGGFSPAQFSQAVREGSQSRMGYAAGGGRMRDIASAGREVFENRQPQTGRMVATLAPILGAGGFAATGGVPGAVAAATFTGAAALPYLKGAAGDIARRVIMGKTAPQVAYRNVERSMRRTFTPQEREAIVRLLQTQGIALQNEEQNQ